MFLYLPAIFQSVIFVFVLDVLARYNSGQNWLLFLLFLVLLLASFRLASNEWSFGYLAIVFFLSVWTILHLIDFKLERYVFLILSSLVYYFLLLGKHRLKVNKSDQTGRSIMAMVLMATVFLFFASGYGIYLNFDIPAYWLMLFYLVNIIVITYQYFVIVEREKKRMVLIYSAVIGFSVLEFGWVVNFWPFGYLTTGIVLLSFYYILWELTQSYFLENLSKKKVLLNLIFFLTVSALVLNSSRWLPAL